MEKHKNENVMTDSTKEIPPVLVITDPGRDIDDILAILLLLHLHTQKYIELVGFVCSGNHPTQILKVLRGWLKLLKFNTEDKQNQIPTFSTVNDLITTESTSENVKIGTSNAKVFIHEEFTEIDNNIHNEYNAAPMFILDQCKKYKNKLIILCIAPLTPLAQAIKLDADLVRNSIHKLLIQGQIQPNTQNIESGNNCNITQLLPSFSSFNLREDESAAEYVFQTLQNSVPFVLLGKYAAYQISLTKRDLLLISDSDNSESLNLSHFTKRLSEEVKGCLDIFRQGNPDLFYQLYKIEMANRTTDTWFEHLDIVSHPYDPLLVLAFREPQLFEPQKLYTKSLTDEKEVKLIEHIVIGMEETNTGIKDTNLVHTQLVQYLRQAFHHASERMASSPSDNNTMAEEKSTGNMISRSSHNINSCMRFIHSQDKGFGYESTQSLAVGEQILMEEPLTITFSGDNLKQGQNELAQLLLTKHNQFITSLNSFTNTVNNSNKTESLIETSTNLVLHNSFNTDSTVVLYPLISLFNHSCSANCILIAEDTRSIIYVIRPILPNTELTFNYFTVHNELYYTPTKIRKDLLQRKFGFNCKCNRCNNNNNNNNSDEKERLLQTNSELTVFELQQYSELSDKLLELGSDVVESPSEEIIQIVSTILFEKDNRYLSGEDNKLHTNHYLLYLARETFLAHVNFFTSNKSHSSYYFDILMDQININRDNLEIIHPAKKKLYEYGCFFLQIALFNGIELTNKYTLKSLHEQLVNIEPQYQRHSLLFKVLGYQCFNVNHNECSVQDNAIPADSVQFCSNCAVASYCSRNCQKLHWKLHKPACQLQKK